MLSIQFPKQNKIRRTSAAVTSYNPIVEPRAWRDQKPRMSSARIMMEVRRRLWQEACAESTGFYQTDKLIERIKALDKRIEKRCKNETQVYCRNNRFYSVVPKPFISPINPLSR